MLIFNPFSVGFNSLCHSAVLVLRIFTIHKTENLYMSPTEHLKQTGKK